MQKGDHIFDCPVPIFAEIPAEKLKVIPKVKVYDLITITQTCDLKNGKAEFVAMYPIYSLANYEQINPEFSKKGRWEEVRKGRIEGLYLLSSDETRRFARNSLAFEIAVSRTFLTSLCQIFYARRFAVKYSVFQIKIYTTKSFGILLPFDNNSFYYLRATKIIYERFHI